jgi:hypothetical protein
MAIIRRPNQLAREGVQMGFVAWRDLEDWSFDLDEVARIKPRSQRRGNLRPRPEERLPAGVLSFVKGLQKVRFVVGYLSSSKHWNLAAR